MSERRTFISWVKNFAKESQGALLLSGLVVTILVLVSLWRHKRDPDAAF